MQTLNEQQRQLSQFVSYYVALFEVALPQAMAAYHASNLDLLTRWTLTSLRFCKYEFNTGDLRHRHRLPALIKRPVKDTDSWARLGLVYNPV